MGSYTTQYILAKDLGQGFAPSKVIWQWDNFRRALILDHGSKMDEIVYIESGAPTSGVTRFIPREPLDDWSHSSEILAIFAPTLFEHLLTKNQFRELEKEIKLKAGKDELKEGLLNLESQEYPDLLLSLINSIESVLDYRFSKGIASSKVGFRDKDNNNWVLFGFDLERITLQNTEGPSIQADSNTEDRTEQELLHEIESLKESKSFLLEALSERQKMVEIENQIAEEEIREREEQEKAEEEYWYREYIKSQASSEEIEQDLSHTKNVLADLEEQLKKKKS